MEQANNAGSERERHELISFSTKSFGGEVIDAETLEDPEKRKNFDLMAFIGRNNKDIRWPEIKNTAQTLRKQYKKVGAIGFCYGEFEPPFSDCTIQPASR